jgi:hypothetical protein
MRKTYIAFLLMAFAYPLVSQEQSEFPSTSGNAFVRVCSALDKNSDEQTRMDYVHTAACIGYLTGIIDGVSEEAAYSHAMTERVPPSPFCMPDDAENGQLIRIVLKYIGDHPEEAHKRTAFLISLALKQAFPCSTHPGKKQ